MAYKSALIKILYFHAAIFTVLLCFVKASIAQMPEYALLEPVSSVVSAPLSVTLDKNQYLYVTEPSLNRLLIFNQSGDNQHTFSDVSENTKPSSVAVDDDGRIYIGNNMFNDTKDNVEVHEIINTDGTYSLHKLFTLGAEVGDFTNPTDIELDNETGNVYIVDSVENIIKVYNPDNPNTAGNPSDSFKFSFDGTANGGGAFEVPTSIVIDKLDGELIVLDHPKPPLKDNGGARIQRFDMNGNYIHGYDMYGNQIGDMLRPKNIDLDNIGRIYVTDSLQHVVLIYERNADVLDYLGVIFVDQENKLTNATGLAISNQNILYVTRTMHPKVERYGILPFALMDVAPSLLSFSGNRGDVNPSAKNVAITNNGTVSLDWTASTDSSWITLPETSGTIEPSASSTMEVGVVIEGLVPALYQGAVTVISSSGLTEVINVQLNVQDVPPDADAGGPYNAAEGQPVTFDASGSGAVIAFYSWDIHNDGSYEYENNLYPTQSHVFADVPFDGETYYVKLLVEDNFGNTDSTFTSVYVADAIPSADFTGSATTGSSPLTVNFTNTSSGYDTPLTYEWDFNGDGNVDSTEMNPSHIYAGIDTYTVALTVTDSDGSTNSLQRTEYIDVSNAYFLNVYKDGTSTGTVVSQLQGIDCGSDCDETYAEGTLVTLTAIPDSGSLFSDWSGGGCSGTGDCVTAVNAAIDVTASFDSCQNLPVRIDDIYPAYYESIQLAYDAADDEDIIPTQAARFTESIDFNVHKSVVLQGGYSCDYLSHDSKTRLKGTITISNGTVTMGDIIIE